MGRQRSPNRDKAFNLYKESGGRLSSAEIAAQLGEKINNINSWRSQDKWRDKVRKVGAPYDNQNAIGNNGGAPHMNQNHYVHGLYSKYFPKVTVDIMKQTEGMDPIDILWQSIHIKFAAIIRSQQIMFVEDRNDLTKVLKRQKEFTSENSESWEKEYELQFAWDKQANFLKAQSAAMGQLTNMIKRYEELLHANWDLATEEQKQRVEKLKVSVSNANIDIQSRRKIAEDKLQLERERFEHTKEIDSLKVF